MNYSAFSMKMLHIKKPHIIVAYNYYILLYSCTYIVQSAVLVQLETTGDI